jgi:hypothetical protein
VVSTSELLISGNQIAQPALPANDGVAELPLADTKPGDTLKSLLAYVRTNIDSVIVQARVQRRTKVGTGFETLADEQTNATGEIVLDLGDHVIEPGYTYWLRLDFGQGNSVDFTYIELEIETF